MYTKQYKTEWCENCNANIVICPSCNSDSYTHRGSIGKIKIHENWYYDDINDEYDYDYRDCLECENSRKEQEKIAPEVLRAITKIYIQKDSMKISTSDFDSDESWAELGGGNSNHFKFTPTENNE